MEIKSNFHFPVTRPDNIRLSRELEGGALLDVGCYPVRLAAEFFGAEHESAWATASRGGQGVDVDTWGVLGYPAGRRLLLSCGLRPQLRHVHQAGRHRRPDPRDQPVPPRPGRQLRGHRPGATSRAATRPRRRSCRSPP